MLNEYVKRCKLHGNCSAASSLGALDRGIDERFETDKNDWNALPKAAVELARESVTLRTLDQVVRAPHVGSKLNGEICAGTYMIADLYNELTAVRKALIEANASLVINSLDPVEIPDADSDAE